MMSFNREDFTDDSWYILCSEFEVDPYSDEIYGLIMLDNDNEEELDEEDDDFDEFIKERENM